LGFHVRNESKRNEVPTCLIITVFIQKAHIKTTKCEETKKIKEKDTLSRFSNYTVSFAPLSAPLVQVFNIQLILGHVTHFVQKQNLHNMG
ncbi:hypothetical protein ACJX0J_031014, partial [Zea mays]